MGGEVYLVILGHTCEVEYSVVTGTFLLDIVIPGTDILLDIRI